MFKYVVVIAALVELFLLSGSQALAQGYPNKPVRVVVPFPPGSGTDLITRLVADRLARKWSQQVLVDNRPGAAGIVGTEAVAKAAPDGHTFLIMTVPNHTINALLMPNLPYDSVKDFAPVAAITTSDYVLVLHPSVPADNLKAFIAFARARPGQLNYGSVGSGVTPPA